LSKDQGGGRGDVHHQTEENDSAAAAAVVNGGKGTEEFGEGDSGATTGEGSSKGGCGESGGRGVSSSALPPLQPTTTTPLTPSPPPQLARLSLAVCMTPRSLVSGRVAEARASGFESGCTFTHWPHEANVASQGNSSACSSGKAVKYAPIELPPEALKLL
jgi:hypothetical protein